MRKESKCNTKVIKPQWKRKEEQGRATKTARNIKTMINKNLLIITLNVNGLNPPIKKQAG